VTVVDMFVDIYNTDKQYNIIYADPPWRYNQRNNKKTKFGGGVHAHYPTMSIDVNPHNLFTTALDLEYGSAHSDLLDLSDDEVVDFDVFRMICYAVAISAYGLDAIRVSEKQRAKKYKHKRKGERINE